MKFYVKSEELLTSTGVSVAQIRDPLTDLFYSKNDYVRRIFSEDGHALTRLECSFYGCQLKEVCSYLRLISRIIP
jgi:D-alanine-D-alanine ligase-like ATP-grasp enzyme